MTTSQVPSYVKCCACVEKARGVGGNPTGALCKEFVRRGGKPPYSNNMNDVIPSPSRRWTIEVQNTDGTWTKLASGKAWTYNSAENAQKDIDRSKKWMNGRPARPVLR